MYALMRLRDASCITLSRAPLVGKHCMPTRISRNRLQQFAFAREHPEHSIYGTAACHSRVARLAQPTAVLVGMAVCR